MLTVNMLEAKTNLSRLVEAVESGAESEIVIARNGRPAARITAVSPPRGVKLGLAKGLFSPPEPDADLDAEVAELFTQSRIFPGQT